MNKKHYSRPARKLMAFTLLATLSFSPGCDLIDKVKDKVAVALTTTKEGLENLLDKSVQSLGLGSGSISENIGEAAGLIQDAKDLISGTDPTALAPSLAAGAGSCVTKQSNRDHTVVITNYDCAERNGQIKFELGIDTDSGKTRIQLTYTDYNESVTGLTMNGTQTWTMRSLVGGGMLMSLDSSYTMDLDAEDASLLFTENIDLEFTAGTLNIDGSSTVSEGDNTAVLSFSDVVFSEDECPAGPAAGTIRTKNGVDYIEIKVTECGIGAQVSLVDGKTTTDNLEAPELDAFFAEYIKAIKDVKADITDAAGPLAVVEEGSALTNAYASCTGIPAGSLKTLDGIWCGATGIIGTGSGTALMACADICGGASGAEAYLFLGEANFSDVPASYHDQDHDGQPSTESPPISSFNGLSLDTFTAKCIDSSAPLTRGTISYVSYVPGGSLLSVNLQQPEAATLLGWGADGSPLVFESVDATSMRVYIEHPDLSNPLDENNEPYADTYASGLFSVGLKKLASLPAVCDNSELK